VTRRSLARRPVRRLAATSLLIVALLVTLAGPASAASPKAWTTSVCGALDTWVTKIDQASSKAAKAAPKSAADVKKRLGKLLSTAQAQTKTLIADLKGAGKPDVQGGQQIAATMREGYAQALRTITQARKSLAQASTTDPQAFTTAARTSQDALEAGLEAIQAAFSAARTADAAPLLKAFAANDDCQIVSA
jgi:hypothetical protein